MMTPAMIGLNPHVFGAEIGPRWDAPPRQLVAPPRRDRGWNPLGEQTRVNMENEPALGCQFAGFFPTTTAVPKRFSEDL